VINNNNIKVVICVIKDEKIKGYDLSIEDYNIKGSQASKRVDLIYLCKTIFPKEDKKNDINKVIEKYKDRYQSLTYEKEIPLSEYYKLQPRNKELELEVEKWKKLYEQIANNKDSDNKNNG